MSISEQLLFSIEESFEDNFTTFHNNVFHLGLSNDAIVLYLRLKSMAYGKKTFSYPSVQTLADYFGVNRRTIQRWLKELIDRGVITRIEWFNEKTKMQTSNRYLIRDISKIEISTGVTQMSHLKTLGVTNLSHLKTLHLRQLYLLNPLIWGVT